MFDTAVNMGVKRANILFQENEDWREYLLSRIARYINISAQTKNKYLKGWINRVLDLYSEAKRS
jgi:lysozyme family protein